MGGWLTIRTGRRPARRAWTAPACCRGSRLPKTLLCTGRQLGHFAPFFLAARVTHSKLVLGQACVPDVHRAHLGELAHRLPVSRHRCTRRRPRVPLEKPLLRAAITTLAASRFTSYSKGPGRVSSKSFRSKSSARSGDARTHRSSTDVRRRRVGQSGRTRRGREVGGHDLGAPR